MNRYNILVLCTGNSARSILSEVLLNVRGEGRFSAWSAGSHPTGRVNPFAIDVLRRHGLSTTGLRSKSWDEFAAPEAPRLDFVITVCGNAAGEVCPVWPGLPGTAHWGVPDPAAVEGSDAERAAAFDAAFEVLDRRVMLFAQLPFDALDAAAILRHARDIGTR
jgi:arsenate reductase